MADHAMIRRLFCPKLTSTPDDHIPTPVSYIKWRCR